MGRYVIKVYDMTSKVVYESESSNRDTILKEYHDIILQGKHVLKEKWGNEIYGLDLEDTSTGEYIQRKIF